MKVLLINNGYPSHNNPNYTTYIKSIEECIKESGCQVNNIVLQYNGEIKTLSKIIQYLRFWSNCLTSKLDADVVYINHIPFAWTILFNPNLRKRRVIIHWHGNDLVGKSKPLKWIHNLISKKCSKYQHIVPSEYFKRKLLEKFKLSLPVLVSPSGGVDTELFCPSDSSVDNQGIVIGYASGLIEAKGADLLYELMKRNADIENATHTKIAFKVINYGADAEEYIEKFKSTGVKLETDEIMGKAKMPNFFNSISILVMPSIREGESLGLVVLEAMACGKPVLTHDICAFPEFVVAGVSGERSKYSLDIEKRTDVAIEALVKIINNYSTYNPREIVMKSYSTQSVIDFYKTLLA